MPDKSLGQQNHGPEYVARTVSCEGKMKTVSRRDMLKTGLLVPAAAAVHGIGPLGTAIEAAAEPTGRAVRESSSQNAGSGAGRERLLLDFGWRFHLGNADDPSKGFGFGSGRTGNFQKTGNFL